ncbi:MAG: ArsC family transcriptional regulator [Oscillospiraceae bacterium]|nr:ArsC family transcriptional regulator [Oscillospiraceae bacterium]
MNIQIFGKAKCFDTKKAERYFKERGVKFQAIDILQKGLSKGELNAVIGAVGGIDNLVTDKAEEFHLFKYLTPDAKPDKLAECPKLYKTPIVRNGKAATIGYCPDVWKKWE